jgi:lipopolysaccharide transport system permease protein
MSHPVERIIHPSRGWWRIDWAGIWRYRDLLWLNVRRDFVARFQQTILGPAWFVIQPVISAVVFTLVFGSKVAALTGPPSFLFYLVGMLLWSFFANILGAAGNTFQTNAPVFTKVYFPRLIVPLAATISSAIPLVVQAVVTLAVYFYFAASSTVKLWHVDGSCLLLLPWCVVQTALFGLGVSLVTSALSAKYRDLQHALPFVVQMWMFVTPVIFPYEQLGRTARVIALLNPLTPIVETVRRAFFGTGTVNPGLFAISIGLTFLTLLAGLLLFQRVERTFADSV